MLGKVHLSKEVMEEGNIPDYFRSTGWVYVLSNPCMPGIYKIGMTTQMPEDRVKDLSSATGVPTPFEIEMVFYSDNPKVDEAEVHMALADKRVSENREFFKCSLFDIEGACIDFGLIKKGEKIEELASRFDLVSFESLSSLNAPSIIRDTGLTYFGDSLAIIERLIRIGANQVKNLICGGHDVDCVLFSNNTASMIRSKEAQEIREQLKEIANKQIESGIYGPTRPSEF